MKQKNGFTLVELSIVIIVIGLLSGAILKGQGIIRNAKLKRIASDYSNVATAMYTYEDRYEQLPGDDATSVIAASMPSPGDEDGVISASESDMVFRHLRKAGLLKGDADSKDLSHALNGKIHVVQANLVNTLLNGNKTPIQKMNAAAVCFDNVLTEDAELLDKQNDDGKHDSGSVQSGSNYVQIDELTSICFEI
jgi:prepilin-type N-terminal cleavage/methylation domain-containing protein